MAADRAGNVYIADANKHVILKAAPLGTNWIVTIIAGKSGSIGTSNGTNDDARFESPGGVAVDAAGNLYVADSGNNCIRKVTPSGTNWIATTIAGVASPTLNGGDDGTNGVAKFSFPLGIAVDADGNLFIGDNGNVTIRKIRPSSTNWITTTIAGSAGTAGYFDGTNGDAQFTAPIGVAVDSADNVYVADAANDAIRKVTPSGTNWIVTTIGGQAAPGLGGTPGSADGPADESSFWFPVGVAVDAGGAVYVADQNNCTVRKIIPAGGDWNTVTIGGSAGVGGNAADGTNVAAVFNSPSGVAVDFWGNVFVTDYPNNDVRLGQIFPPPLQIRPVGRQMNIFYQFAEGTNLNFTLQSTTNLNNGTWDDVTNVWQLDTNNVASVALTPTNKVPNVFFRLLLP